VPESLSTEVAGVGLVPRVSQHVCLQLVHSGESFVTVVARVWLFASVGHLMVLQLLIGPELFVTVSALIVPRRSTRVVWGRRASARAGPGGTVSENFFHTKCKENPS